MESVAPFVSDERLRAFERVTGVDPTQIEEAWYVSYELGGLLLISSGPHEARVELAFQKRAASLKRRNRGDERLIHWVGVTEGSPAALLILRGHFIAMSFGDPTLIKLMRGYVEGKLTRTPPLLRSRFLREAAVGVEEHASAMLWLGPLSREDRVLYGMLAAVARLDTDAEALHLGLDAYGAWDGLTSPEWLSFCQARLDAPELRALGVELKEDRLRGSCEPPDSVEGSGPAPLEHCEANLQLERRVVLDRWLRLILGRLADLGGADEPPPANHD